MTPPLGGGDRTFEKENAVTVTEADATFRSIVERLSRQSVDKHFDAYTDVAWDDPDFAVDPSDPRWDLWEGDGLGHTDWYRSQPEEVRSAIALHRVAAAMRIGWEFENILQRGLLSYVFRLPNGAEAFRYLHHEIIEESQHTLMFQEFVNRSGLPVRGLPRLITFVAERFVIRLSRADPQLFFLFVLGGEDPVDHLQRQRLRAGVRHPLLERIMRIHVTEEARHISFARNYLRIEVPRSSRTRRLRLALRAPLLYGAMVRIMVDPPAQLGRAHGIPSAVMREAVRHPSHRAIRAAAGSKPRKLCTDLGLVNAFTARLWDLAGLTQTAGADAGAT
ncbi:MAG: diiron oxygenase [Actinomycetota bacterium]|nr:diiron oxygenase [Actinomycetota bacterium]